MSTVASYDPPSRSRVLISRSLTVLPPSTVPAIQSPPEPGMTRLTVDQISGDSRSRDAASVISLQLNHRALSDVSCLGAFKNLERLDIRSNCLKDLQGLSSCTNLKWLSVVENKLESLKGIEGLSKLKVLNAGKNKLRTMDGISSVTSLQALILNDNSITSICKLHQLEHLNTLVLSRNPIRDIGDALVKVKSIIKLSLSHCHLETIGSSLMSCVDLKEARFSHNKIVTLPTELALNYKLQILDMGNNLLENWSDIKVISSLHNLKNLNLQGNPIAEKDRIVKKVIKSVPNLQIFNTRPIESSSYHTGSIPLNNASDVEDDKKLKRKKSRATDKKDLKGNVLKKSSDEAYDFASFPDAEVGKIKNMKRKKNADVLDNSTPKSTDFGASKKTKMKNTDEGGRKFEGIDDAETPFMDLILSDKSAQVPVSKKEDHGTAPEGNAYGGLIVDHTRKKKKKKANGIDTDSTSIQLLPPTSEVGMGGPSTWD